MSPLAPISITPVSHPREDLAKAAQGFEAIFVRQLLSFARKADFGGEDVFGSQGLDTFRQMQDERFADIAAERGSFGLAKMIEAQLGTRLGAGPSTGSGRAGLGARTSPAPPEPVEGVSAAHPAKGAA